MPNWKDILRARGAMVDEQKKRKDPLEETYKPLYERLSSYTPPKPNLAMLNRMDKQPLPYPPAPDEPRQESDRIGYMPMPSMEKLANPDFKNPNLAMLNKVEPAEIQAHQVAMDNLAILQKYRYMGMSRAIPTAFDPRQNIPTPEISDKEMLGNAVSQGLKGFAANTGAFVRDTVNQVGHEVKKLDHISPNSTIAMLQAIFGSQSDPAEINEFLDKTGLLTDEGRQKMSKYINTPMSAGDQLEMGLGDVTKSIEGNIKANELDKTKLTPAQKFVHEGTQVVAEQVPGWMLAYLTGGSSKAGEAAKVAETVGKKFLPKVAGKAVETVKGLAPMIPFGMSAAGANIRDAEQKELGTQESRYVHGAITGTFEMLTEKIPFDSMSEVLKVNKLLGKIPADKGLFKFLAKNGLTKNFAEKGGTALKWLSHFGENLAQELVMNPIQGLSEKAMLDPGKPWLGENGVLDPTQVGPTTYSTAAMEIVLVALGLPMNMASRGMADNYVQNDKMPTEEEVTQLANQLVSDMEQVAKEQQHAAAGEAWSTAKVMDEVAKQAEAGTPPTVTQPIPETEAPQGRAGQVFTAKGYGTVTVTKEEGGFTYFQTSTGKPVNKQTKLFDQIATQAEDSTRVEKPEAPKPPAPVVQETVPMTEKAPQKSKEEHLAWAKEQSNAELMDYVQDRWEKEGEENWRHYNENSVQFIAAYNELVNRNVYNPYKHQDIGSPGWNDLRAEHSPPRTRAEVQNDTQTAPVQTGNTTIPQEEVTAQNGEVQNDVSQGTAKQSETADQDNMDEQAAFDDLHQAVRENLREQGVEMADDTQVFARVLEKTDEIRAAKKIGKIFGKSVEFFKPLIPEANAYLHGAYHKGVIFLNAEQKGRNPVETVLFHELTHSMREEAPHLYIAFVNALQGQVKGKEYTALTNRVGALNQQLDESQKLEEFVANLFGEAALGRAFWESFAKEQPSTVEIIIREIKRLLAKVKAAFGRQEMDYTVKKAVKKWEDVARLAGTAMQEYAKEKNPDLYSFDSHGESRRKYNGDSLTPIGDIETKYSRKTEQWHPDYTSEEFGTVNNRMQKELEMFERIFGPLSVTDDLPGKLEGSKRPEVRSIKPGPLGESIYEMVKSGKAEFLLNGPLEKILKSYPLTNQTAILDAFNTLKGIQPESRRFTVFMKSYAGLKGIENKALAKELLMDIQALRSDEPTTSDNGKAGRSVDFLIATCHPTRPCKECYAAGAYVRFSAVRKAYRTTLKVLMDPIGFADEIVKEMTTGKFKNKFDYPFLRLLGSGDLTFTEQVDAFNRLAQKLDRPIHIFSRHHDMLGKLIPTGHAPFLKMGSIDAQLVEVYGMEFLKTNLKERGIANCFLFTDPSEVSVLKELYDAKAVKLVLSATHDLHEKLPEALQISSCPCDAKERSYMGSCGQCALSDLGCFMSFATLGVDKEGKIWDLDDTARPDDITAVGVFADNTKERPKALSVIAADILRKSINLINLYTREFKKGGKVDIPLKDIRFGDEDSITRVDNLKAVSWYKGQLTRMVKQAEQGTFYLPGGPIQSEVAYRDFKKMETPEEIAAVRDMTKVKLPKDGIKYSRKEAPVFFSQLQRVMEQKMPNSAPAPMVLALAKDQTVKQDEVKWTGIEEWLSTKQGKVTKDEVLKFLKLNDIDIEEVVLDGKPHYTPEVEQKMADKEKEIEEAYAGLLALYDELRVINGREPITEDERGELIGHEFRLRNRIQRQLYNIEGAPDYEDTEERFHQLVQTLQLAEADLESVKIEYSRDPKWKYIALPGGTDYAELLLKLPLDFNQRKKPMKWEQPIPGTEYFTIGDYAIGKKNSQGTSEYVFMENGWRIKGGFSTLDEAKEYAQGLVTQRSDYIPDSEKRTFQSGHYEDKNVLAHVRMDSRTDKEGNKVLFVQEFQSDWHQKGHSLGYRQEYTDPEIKALVKRFKELSDAIENMDIDDWFSGKTAPLNRERDLVVTKLNEHGITSDSLTYGVEDAPFKKTWTDLAFKRMLRYAAENGFDILAWPNPELVPKIEKWPHTYEFIRSKEDEDASKQFGGILDRYEKTIPFFANKYVKKWGTAIKTVEIPYTSEEYSNYTEFRIREREGWEDGITEYIIEGHNRYGDWHSLGYPYVERSEAERIMATMGGVLKLPSVAITPAMKESVLAGEQPKYSRKNAKLSYPETIKESDALDEDTKETMAIHNLLYRILHNKDIWEDAVAEVEDDYQEAIYKVNEWIYDWVHHDGSLDTPEKSALAQAVLVARQKKARALKKAGNMAEYENEMNAIQEFIEHISTAAKTTGQAIQALSILKRLSPDGILYHAKRTMEKHISHKDKQKRDNTTQKVVDEFSKVNEEVSEQASKTVEKEVDKLFDKAPPTVTDILNDNEDAVDKILDKIEEIVGEAKRIITEKSTRVENDETTPPPAETPPAETPETAPPESKEKKPRKKKEGSNTSSDTSNTANDKSPKAPKEKKPKVPKEPKTPEERLADKVSGDLSDKPLPEEDPVKVMVDTLHKVIKEMYPATFQEDLKAKRRPKDPIDLVIKSFQSFDEYEDVWKAAYDILKERYEDDDNAMDILSEYFEDYFLKRPVAMSKMQEAIKKAMKSIDISIPRIIRENFLVVAEAKTLMKERFMRDAGLSEETAEALEDYINEEFQKLTVARKKKALEQIFKKVEGHDIPAKIKKLLELANLGAFAESVYLPLIGSRINLASIIHDETKQKVNQIVRKHYAVGQGIADSIKAKVLRETLLTGAQARAIEAFVQVEYEKLTNKRKGEILDQIFPDKKKASPERKKIYERIIEWSNLGAFTNAKIRGKVAELLGIPQVSDALASDLWHMANDIQLMPEGEEKLIATLLMLDRIDQDLPPSLMRKVGLVQTMSMLLNFKTGERNVIGNAMASIAGFFDNNLSLPADMFWSFVHMRKTGEYRRTAMMTGRSYEGYGFWQGGARTTVRAWKDSLKGIDTLNLNSPYEVKKRRTFRFKDGPWWRHPLSNSGAVAEIGLHIWLSVPDAFFYGAAYAESLRQQMLVAKSNGKPVSKPTPEMIKRAEEVAALMTYQDERRLTKGMVAIKNGLNIITGTKPGEFGLGDFFMKFVKVPANLAMFAFDYSPMGVFNVCADILEATQSKDKWSDGKGERLQYKAVRHISKTAIGIGVLVAGYALASLGIVTGGDDKDEIKRELERAQGIRKYSVNVGALKRWIMSGFDKAAAKPMPGDEYWSYDWILPISMTFAAGANIETRLAEAPKRDKWYLSLWDVISGAVEGTASAVGALFAQPFTQNLQKMFASGYDDETTVDKLFVVLMNNAAGFIPALIRQGRYINDNKVRDVRTDYPTSLEYGWQNFLNKLPGLSDNLPSRVTITGDEQEIYPGGLHNPLNIYLNPVNISRYKGDARIDFLLSLYEKTGGSKVGIPNTAAKAYTVDVSGTAYQWFDPGRTGQSHSEVKLTRAEQNDLQMYIGEKSMGWIQKNMEQEEFMKASPQVQAKILSQGYGAIGQMGQEYILKKIGRAEIARRVRASGGVAIDVP